MIDQHSSLSEKFLKKGFWLYLFTIIIAPTGYIIKILIAGSISVSELGIIYGIISLLTLITALNDVGISQSMNYYIPRFVEEKRYDKIKSIFIFGLSVQLLTSVILMGMFYFGADFLGNMYFKNITAINAVKIFSLFFIGINIFQTISTFFMSVQNTLFYKLGDFIRMLFTLIGVVIIYSLNLGSVENFSISWIIGLYASVLFSSYIFFRKYYLKYLYNESIIQEFSFYKEIISYAAFIFLGAQASVILSQMDMQMIIFFLGSSDAGFYTTYLSIIGVPFLLLTPILQFIIPVFSQLYKQNSLEKIKKIRNIFTEFLIIFSLFTSSFFFIFGKNITIGLFGDSYLYSSEILLYSILFLVFIVLLQLNFSVFAGIGKVRERFKIISIGLLINFLLNIYLINIIGAPGAALATGIGWICIYIMTEYELFHTMPLSMRYSKLINKIIILGLLGSIFYYLKLPISYTTLFISGVIWLGVFIILNYSDFKIVFGEIRKIKKG